MLGYFLKMVLANMGSGYHEEVFRCSKLHKIHTEVVLFYAVPLVHFKVN